MRIVITGGGTGGHIYPAIAIVHAILQEWPRAEILYVGTETGMENKIVPQAGIDFITIDVIGWQRKISIQAVKALWKALMGLHQADRIIYDFYPHLVIGTGGYVCLPVVWSAAQKGIPTLIHEQNVMPGLANKFLSKRVDGVMLTFCESKKYFHKSIQDKLYVTGLPIRSDILRATREEGLAYFGFSPDKKTLLGVGGSRGARSINKAMIDVCKELGDKIQIVHLTGASEYESFLRELSDEGIDVGNCGNIIIRPYLHHMEFALACADLCVARSGAAFISEMTAKGLPGILIPYPHAADNHQEFNAKSLAAQYAAEMVQDKDLTGKVLLKKINSILFNEEKRKIMAQNSKKAGKPEAIEKIIEVIKRYIKK